MSKQISASEQTTPGEQAAASNQTTASNQTSKTKGYLKIRGTVFLVSVVIVIGQAEVMHILRWGPVWLLPAVYILMLVLSVVFYDPEHARPNHAGRTVAKALIFLMIAINVLNMSLLLRRVFMASLHIAALDLVLAGSAIWVVTWLTFAFSFWEIDGGGPEARLTKKVDYPDFLFPQQQADAKLHVVAPDWHPGFGDYLYVSLTNAIAVSPTDTMPMTPLAKFLMGIESFVCYVIFGVLVASAVNIATGALPGISAR
ncbi:MAG: hypothetical protein FWD65_08350 [Coriobacteriia bacterium]|nr:hypothetical protein [Coriobacteriia bacterium]